MQAFIRGVTATIAVAVIAATVAVAEAGPATAETGVPPTPELVENGSFEQPSLPSGSWGLYGSLPGWSVPAGQLAEVQNMPPDGGGRAAVGAQLTEIDSNASTSLTQALATLPDTTYALRIDYSARPGLKAAQNRVEVYWDGKLLTVLSADGYSATTTAWNTYTSTVKSSGSSTALTLKDAGPSDGLGMYLDGVSVKPLTCRLMTSGAWDLASNWACYLPASRASAISVPGVGNPVEVDAGKTVIMGLGSSGLKPGAPGVTLYRGAGILVTTLSHQDILDSAPAMVAERPALATAPDAPPSSFLTQAELAEFGNSVWEAHQEMQREQSRARMQKIESAREAQEQAKSVGQAAQVITPVALALVVLGGGVVMAATSSPVAIVALSGAVGYMAGVWALA